MPGIAASASLAGELELDVAVELLEALVAADLRAGGPEQPAQRLLEIRSFHHRFSSNQFRARGRARRDGGAACGARRAASCRARRGWCRAARRGRRSARRSARARRAPAAGAGSGPPRSPPAASAAARSARPLRPARGRRSRRAPSPRLQRHLAPLPRPPAQLHGRLQQRELVGPGREAAVAAEVVEAPQHAHQRVVGGLHGDVVELVAAQVRQRRPAAGDLEARSRVPLTPRRATRRRLACTRLLMRAARFEVARRRPTLPHLRGDELDDIAHRGRRRRPDERAAASPRFPRRQPLHDVGLQVRPARGGGQATQARLAGTGSAARARRAGASSRAPGSSRTQKPSRTSSCRRCRRRSTRS